MYKAAIFDMDGVIVNNHEVHVKVWKQFCEYLGVDLNEDEFRSRFFGKSNRDILSTLMGRQLDPQEADRIGERKEAMYRETYRPDVKEVEGLIPFLKWLKGNGIKTAVATSAPPANMHFILDELGIASYFDILTDASGVKEAKPSPEIYTKSAAQLQLMPFECLVFEDSISGIQSATAAGMRVVALLTTHTQDELPKAHTYISNFVDPRLREYFTIQVEN